MQALHRFGGMPRSTALFTLWYASIAPFRAYAQYSILLVLFYRCKLFQERKGMTCFHSHASINRARVREREKAVTRNAPLPPPSPETWQSDTSYLETPWLFRQRQTR